jgi:hypothetical protein
VHREVVLKKWLRRILGAVGMSLTWAAAWGIVGVLIGMFVDPDGSMDEMWVAVGSYPGFLGGVVFFAVLRIAEGRRRFDEWSLSRFGTWGAVAGLLLGLFPFALVAEMAASTEYPLWLLGAVVVGPTTLLSAVLGVGSALLFRYATRAQPPAGVGPEV